MGSIVLQWNEWEISGTQASLLQTKKRSRYAEKDIYYLTPAGEIGHLYIERGLMGMSTVGLMIEKSKALESLEQLDEWKRNKHN